MLKNDFQTIHQSLAIYFMGVLIFSTFGIKLLIDSGSYMIFSPFIFYHFLIGIFLPIILYKAANWKQSIFQSFGVSCTALPILIGLIINGNILVQLIIFYFCFLFSIQLGIINLIRWLAPHQRYFRFFVFCILILLWGTNIILDSIPLIYNFIAPVTISYHLSLITDGILHISTIFYLLFFVLITYGLARSHADA
ncbi:MAG: hypothetical protein VW397_05260 [Candidatus Margulisiibacteriota bacterium]